MQSLETHYTDLLKSLNLSVREIERYNELYDREAESGILEFAKAAFDFNQQARRGKTFSADEVLSETPIGKHSYFQLAGQLVFDTIEKIDSLQGSGAQFLVRSIPSGSINAEVKKFSSGYLILINEGLGTFFLVLLSVILRSRTFQRHLSDDDIGPTYDEKVEVQLLGRLLHSYIRTGYVADANDSLFLNGISRFDDQLFDVYLSLYNEVCSFVIAHELCHMALGHLDKSASKSWLTPVGRVDLIPKSQIQEYEADATAAYVLFSANRVRRKGGVLLREEEMRHIALMEICGGMMLFLFIASWIEDFTADLAHRLKIRLPPIHTHPPAIHRLNHLVDYLTVHGMILDFERSGYAMWFIDHLRPLKHKVWAEIEALEDLRE